MALTKVGSGGIENVTNSANATFLTIDASEQITVASEGGAVTTSVQQGLAKAWIYFNASGPVTNGGFNVSSLSDDGTGSHTMTITNVLDNNTDLSVQVSSNAYHTTQSSDPTTSTFQLSTFHSNNASLDPGRNYITVHGDLA